MLFGTVRKQPVDPSFNLPARRRVIWEHAQDLAVFLRVNVLFNILFIVAVVLLGVVVAVIVNRPSYVINQDQGYIYYRNTERDKLRTSLLRSFLRVTTGGLYTFQPTGYRIDGLEGLVSHKVLTEFKKSAKKQSEARLKYNRRQLWEIRDIRRYFDPKFPQYISIAIQGEKANFEERVTADGLKEIKASSQPTLIMTYLEEVVPSPENPWGLALIGIFEVSEKQKTKLYWDASVPIGTAQEKGSKKKKQSGEYVP